MKITQKVYDGLKVGDIVFHTNDPDTGFRLERLGLWWSETMWSMDSLYALPFTFKDKRQEFRASLSLQILRHEMIASWELVRGAKRKVWLDEHAASGWRMLTLR